MTLSEFENIMNEMEAHAITCNKSIYKARQGHGTIQTYNFIIPNLFKTDNEDKPIIVSPEVKSVLNKDEAENKVNIETEKTEADESTAKYLKENDFATFEKELLDQEADAIQRYTKSRKERTKKLIEIGRQNENQRLSILKANKRADNFLLNAYNQISKFIVDLIDKVVTWLDNAFKKIKKAFNDAVTWVNNGFNTIVSLFSSPKYATGTIDSSLENSHLKANTINT